ncbi:phage holin family protein [Planctomycetaceae bacterium SH139]
MSYNNASGVRRTMADVIELVKLQGRLFAIDSREAVKRSIVSAVLAGLAIAIAVATLTIFLMGISWLLTEQLGWPLSWSLLLVSLISAVVTVLILLASYNALRRAGSALGESADEFGSNIQWLQERLATPPQPPATRNGREPKGAHAAGPSTDSAGAYTAARHERQSNRSTAGTP